MIFLVVPLSTAKGFLSISHYLMRLEDINNLLDEARNSLTNYCTTICKSQCCRKGKILLLKAEEKELIVGDELEQKEAIKNTILEKQDSGNYHFDFEKSGPCRWLSTDTGLCKAYENPGRPTICSDYPLFKVGEYVIAAGNCPAVASGQLDSRLEEVRRKGYRVV